MNTEVKEKWVEAIKSGRYNKGRHHLRSLDSNEQDCYCAMGVLCDLYAQEHEGFKWDNRLPDIYCFTGPDGVDSAVCLPYVVKAWAGLSTAFGKWIENGEEYSIIDISDNTPGWCEVVKSIQKYL